MKKVLVSSIPACDICADGTPAMCDCLMSNGHWANLCESHYNEMGTDVGSKFELLIKRSQDMTYDEWYAKLNGHFEDRFGLSLDDLPDCPYRDWFDSGYTPKQCVTKAYHVARESGDF